jgi:hypothetical protein
MLVDYVIKCSRLIYGMTYKQIRQLAEDWCVNFPVAELITRLQELTGYRAL